ncbi:hypothetical protein KY289_016466 [Solanum tuberosum]|nr:hypothetical protein KY289_016466 [Solanum tuberosum]
MTTNSPGQPLLGVGQAVVGMEPDTRRKYADVLRPASGIAKPIPMKPIAYLHGEPRIIWEEEEVEHMIIKENLEFVVIDKFSYGWPEIQDLRKLIPKHCELRRECKIGLLSNRHVLIRASCLEDYVNLLSKSAFYLLHRGLSYPMRTLKWDPMFDPEEETSTAIAWISFPALPPIFFVKEAVFSLADAVGKPLQVDLATKNQTRPSCTVKVEVDLLSEFPKRINVGVRKQSGEIIEKWIRIKYDYVPKYCMNCRIQGHNDQECYVIHPDLYPKASEAGEDTTEQNKKEVKGIGAHQRERRETNQHRGQEDIHNQKHKKWGWERNKFDALRELEEDGEDENPHEKGNTKANHEVVVESTRKWVEEVFNEKEKGGATCSKRESDQSGSNKENTKKDVVPVHIDLESHSVEKAKNNERDREDHGSTVGNIWREEDEIFEHEGSSNVLEEGVKDLQELTNEEKQQMRDTEEDVELDGNIDKVARDGDLSPRQINNLKSGMKKPSIPLQVKTRSNKESSRGISL